MLALFLLTLVGCNKHSDLEFKLDTAEQLMQNKPDSALYLLSNIPASKIKGKRCKARYALLKSIALDKNYIDTTSFEVIQPALDYYLEYGNADERLRTLYYQGRIFQNQGADDDAMTCFMKASDLGEVITDTLVLANTLVSEAMLYDKQYKLDDFIRCHLRAAELYKTIGNILYEVKSYTNAMDAYTLKSDRKTADSLMQICFPLVKKNKDSESFLSNSILLYTLRFGTKEEIRDFLSKHQHNDLSSDDLMDFAKGYTKLGEYAQALHCLQNVELEADVQDSLKYITIKLDIFKQKGDFKNALRALEDYTAMHEEYMSNLLSQNLFFADQKHQRSCTDTICGDETMKSEPAESHYVVLDSLAIYKIQTDKSMMLNNLIRYQSGKYLLDLSLDDAKKIGISEMMYNQVLEHVEQLNNSNLKLK